MIPKVENIQKSENESFYVGTYKAKWFDRSWHYHSEYELLLITKGHGVRVIGNDNSPFEEGDLVLVGGNVPHAWFSDPSYFEEDSTLESESIYVQFNRLMFGNRFINSPEMLPIQHLLDEAKLGLKYDGHDKTVITTHIKELMNTHGLDRLLKFIKVLWMFRMGGYKKILNDAYFTNSFISKSERISKVHEYVLNNYMSDIKIDDIAALVEMNVSSFCRFFKKMTNRTFSQYVKEIRIDFAQQLLMSTNLPSNIVGFECGFSSVAYFNQCFKAISKMSPLEYRSAFRKV